MASIRSSSDSVSRSFLPSPNLNEKSRLLPDLEEEILSVIGKDEPTDAFLTARSEKEQLSQLGLSEPADACGNSQCTGLTCDTGVFQLPADRDNPKSVLESWVVTYHAPQKKVTAWYQWLGICWWRRIEAEGARILAVVPNCHFNQEELESVCAVAKEEYSTSASHGGSRMPGETAYTIDLERRLRKLDWVVQDEIYDLIDDRIQSSSNAFRRREWKLVMLNEVRGGEITEALPVGGQRCHRRLLDRISPFVRQRRKTPKVPITEYRLILRGAETKANDEGWACHNRYSRPWRDVDEKEVGDIKSSLSRRGSQFGSDKSINF